MREDWSLSPVKLSQTLFWFLILFLPTQLGKHFWPDFSLIFGLRIDYLSPTIYLTDILVLGILVSWGWGKIGNWIIRHWCVMVVLAYLFLTSLLAANSGAALYKFFKILELLFLGFYVAQNYQVLKNSITKLLSVVVIYESLLTWFQFIKQGSLGGIFWYLGERTFSAGTPGIALVDFGQGFLLRPYGTFSHSNSLAGFLLIALILICGFYKGLPKWLRLTTFVLGFSEILISFSQAVWLVGLLVGLGISFVWWRKWKKVIPLMAIFIFLGFSLFLANFGDQSTKERVGLTEVAIKIINLFPLTGVGLNNFINFLPRFWPTHEVYLLQPVHNIFLLITAETGLLGLVIFLWFLYLTFATALCHREASRGQEATAGKQFLVPALGAILILGLFDHYWLTLQQNMLLGAIVFGMIWGKIRT